MEHVDVGESGASSPVNGASTRGPVGHGMSVGRILFVHVIIALLALPSLYDTFTGEEHWPYSPYPMFSRVAPDPAPTYRLFGVTADTPSEEVRLPVAAYAGPLNHLRVQGALARMDAGERREQSLREALQYFLATYEARRLRAVRPMPPLRGLRLYRLGKGGDSKEPGLLIAEVELHGEGP